jgi:hypothetical protein
MAPKNPEDTEQIARVGELVCFSSLIESCRGKGRAFRDEIRSQRSSDWDRSGQAIPAPRGGLRRRNRSVSAAALTQCRRPHTLPSGVNQALELPLASETGECLSFVFESMFGGRSAPR